MRAARLPLNLLAGAVGSLLVVTVVEGGLLAYTGLVGHGPFARSVEIWPYFERDLLLEFRLRPNFRGDNVRINSRGFRGPEFTAEPRPGVERIITLGDSCTFGTYTAAPGTSERYALRNADEADSYPAILQDVLNGGGRTGRYEVINGGVPGYSTSQALRWLESEIFEYRPGLLVVYLGWNDLNNALHPRWKEAWAAYGGWRRRFAETGWGRTAIRLARASATLETLYHAQLIFRRSRDGGRVPTGDPLDRPPAPANGEAAVRLFRENLTLLARRAKARGVRTLLVTLPTPMSRALDGDTRRSLDTLARWSDGAPMWEMYRAANQAIRKVAHDEQVTMVDLATLLDGLQSPQWFSDDVHPNVDGAARLARAVAEVVLSAQAGGG